jgi:uncharacterized protein (DUF58 family)
MNPLQNARDALTRVHVLARFTRPECLVTIEVQNWLAAWLWLAALLWYLAAPHTASAMSLTALSGLWLWALAQAGMLARGMTARRTLRYTAMQVGDELEEEIELVNAAPMPAPWLEIVDRSDVPGYELASVRGIDALSTARWRVRTVCRRRGRFTLGPWELRSSDAFGLLCVRQTYTQPQEVIVYPSLAALPDYLLPHTPASGERHLLRQPLPASTLNAATTRPHLPGDPLRHIHWRTTARRESPYTKVFEPESTRTVWLLPDFDPGAHLGEGSDSTEETLVMLAASLAAQLLRQSLAVGLIAAAGGNDGRDVVIVPPRRGPAYLWEHLRALAPLHPALESLTLAQLLPRARPLLSSRDLVIVLTPALDNEWPRALVMATHHGARAEAILLDPASFGGLVQAEAFSPLLAGLGVRAHVVRRGEVQPLSAAYGELRRWEFMTLGTGRVIARQTPRSAPSLEAQLAALSSKARA